MRLLYTGMPASVKSATNFGTTDRLAALRLQLMAGELARQIGERIRQRRTELGLNQGDLAALIGSTAVNNQRISDWERGVNKPSERYMEELAVALERDVSWFYSGDVSPTPDLMAALPGTENQLDRIEAKLDQLLARVGDVDIADFTEQITRDFEALAARLDATAATAQPADEPEDAPTADPAARPPGKRRSA
jgi:transcriptional regulator with XRE-family HTH domain